ncbi:MAG: hypothetical protein ACK5OS_02010 [Chryseotalea sp.]
MPKVQVTYRELLDSDRWKEFCDRYKVNEYCVAEGADPDTVVYITLQEAKDWGLIDDLGDNEEYNPDKEDSKLCMYCYNFSTSVENDMCYVCYRKHMR